MASLGCGDRAAYRYAIWSRYRYYLIPIQGIEMTHSKRYSKSILTSSIWEKSNNNLTKYHHANHKIPVYSNKMTKFDMWSFVNTALASSVAVSSAHYYCTGSCSRLCVVLLMAVLHFSVQNNLTLENMVMWISRYGWNWYQYRNVVSVLVSISKNL